MKLSDGVKELAVGIAKRCEEESSNCYTLFLGAACARSAGVPTPEEMASQFFESPLYKLIAKLMPDLVPKMDALNRQELVSAFYKFLDKLPPVQGSMALQKFYRNIPIPLFYQDLAVLIRAGYFRHVLTTNFDALLEQAMHVAGLTEGSDFEVVNLNTHIDSQSRTNIPKSSKAPIMVIKLHGDLADSEIPKDPAETEIILEERSEFLKQELQGDMVMVGYELESEYINNWLTISSEKQLWWVSPNPPQDERFQDIQRARTIKLIDGPNATCEEFFGQLSLMLLRLPILESMTKAIDDLESTNVSLSFQGILSETQLSDEYLEREYLQDKLRHCQEVLHGLGQLTVAGEKNLSLQIENQIEYQKRQIARLEDQLRQLSTNKPRVVKLMDQVINSASHSADAGTISFLKSQVDAVKKEYEHEEPNQHIVSAAIGATIVLAERLGTDVVELDVLNELISFAPSTSVKGA